MFTDRTDAGNPGVQIVGRIEIVVTFVSRSGGIIAKPGVVATAVETDIADRGSNFCGGDEGAADERLVNVAETSLVLTEELQRLRGLPGSVAQFDHEWIIGEAL